MRRQFTAICLAIALLSISVSAQRVSQTAPVPNRTIAAPVQHRPPGADHPESTAGTIEGFVYWDANTVSHLPSNSCSGLAITVSVGNSSGGPLTAYTPLATLSNNFKYVGEVKEFLVGGKLNIYDVCTYGYDHVPVGPDLQVKLTVTQPAAFSPVTVPQFAILGPIKIINAQCGMLPRIVNPTASDLTAHWGSCQDMAYDVNFVMHAAPRPPLGGGAQAPSGSASTPAEKAPGPPGTPLLTQPGPARTPMLSGSPQQGMLASGAGSAMQSSSTSGGLQGSRGQAPPAIPDGTPQNYTGATRGSTPQILTNADVASMLKAGLAESVIISSIRSAKKNFDFSSAGCQTLQRARVNVGILAAMGDGSTRPCPEISGNTPAATPGGKVELNPQPLPPGSKMAPANRTALKSMSLAPPKALQRVTNPRLMQQNASIIAVLEQQRLATHQEAATMKLGIRSAASASVRTASPSANLLVNAPVQGLGPERTQGAQGSFSSSIAHAPAFNSIVLTCSTDPTPRILRVSGGQAPAIFSPEAKYNLYTIAGCSLGQSQSGNSAYLFGADGFKANLNIDYWSDNGITVHLDPALVGVLDQDNVTLVVAPAGKQELQKSGFKFYAARGMPAPDGTDQEVQLTYKTLPQNNVALAYANTPVVIGWNGVPQNAESRFPSFSFAGTPVLGWVFRYAYGHSDPNNPCFINDVHYPIDTCYWYFEQNHVGNDVWDFRKLAPGFVISSYNLYYQETDPSRMCGAWDDEATGDKDGLVGKWDFNLNAQNQINVNWPLYYCHDREEFGSRENKQVLSSYGLAVWVLGPRCVDPWTGQKDQSCVNQVKQLL